MRKLVLTLLVLVTAASFCAFADVTESPSIEFSYKINRYVADSYEAHFLDFTTKVVITENEAKELTLEETLSNPVVILEIKTNKVRSYSLTLEFKPMITQSDQTFIGRYEAWIKNNDNHLVGDVVIPSNGDPLQIEIPGDTSTSPDNVATFWYPISFQFSDYIDDYPVGEYSSTITLGVSPT